MRASKSTKSTNDAPTLSIVIPCFNEEKSIVVLVQTISSILLEAIISFEIIIVDDGSQDSTWDSIGKLVQSHPQVMGLRLSRNFSHQNALLAGLSCARGEAIVTMDGDMQHPPAVIPELIDAWRQGFKVVTTGRSYGNAASPLKKIASRVFYRVFAILTGVNIERGSSDFCLLDREALNPLLEFATADRFIRGSIQWMGFSSKKILYTSAVRYSGTSSYGLKRMMSFAGTAVGSFSTRPLWAGIWLGIFVGLAAFGELIYVLMHSFSGHSVPGWASTLSVISFLFAILFFVVGLIGIYVGRVYSLLQNRPLFIVAEQIGHRDSL
jgi:polyisoprenyl-phosphate glycosyltransferase